jgi:NADH-quinone oxidoreductase subunit H
VTRQAEIGWFILLQPLAFIIFLISMLAEVNRTPFDLPEAESELIAGHHTEYSGLKFGMFYLAEYIHILFMSALAATLFLGGYHIPFVPADHPIHVALGPFVLIGKTFAFVFAIIWIRGTLPRVRVDHLMSFAWKILVPLCLLNIFVVGLLAPLLQGLMATGGLLSHLTIIVIMLLANAIMFGIVFYFINRLVRRSQAQIVEGAMPAR